MSDCGCFPDAAELARLAENAQAGRTEAFVGTGHPDTVLSCAHGEQRLGDAMVPPARTCSETTKAGEPCKGTPGDDGLCAAHKPRGDADGTVAPAAEPDPQAEEAADAAAEGGQVGGGQEGSPDQG